MTKIEVTAMLLVIKNAYQRFYEKQTEDSARQEESIWREMMADLDGATVKAVIKNWIAKEKWPPTIADIREAVYLKNNPELESAEAAWEKVIFKKWDDSVQQWGFLKWGTLCDAGKRALNSVGKGRIFHALTYDSSQIGYLHKEFIDNFNAFSKTDKEHGMLSIGAKSPQTKAIIASVSKQLSAKGRE